MEDGHTLRIIVDERESLETIFGVGDGRKRLASTFECKDHAIGFCGLKAFGE